MNKRDPLHGVPSVTKSFERTVQQQEILAQRGIPDGAGWLQSVVVYCGSRPGNNPAYSEAAKEVGVLLGKKGFDLVYGGGGAGLMGDVSNAAREVGAKVTGVTLAQFAKQGAVGNDYVVGDLNTRIALMGKLSQAGLLLPGGLGSGQEFFEWLGFHDTSDLQPEKPHMIKPMIILNVDGYYDGFVMQLKRMRDESLIRDDVFDKLVFVVDTPEAAVDLFVTMNQSPPLTSYDLAQKHPELTGGSAHIKEL